MEHVSCLQCYTQTPPVIHSGPDGTVIGELNNTMFCVIISCVCSPTTTAVTVSVLVSGVVVSAISTAIVTSIIVWCVMRRPPSPAGTGKGATELATVIYDTPHVIKDQSAISTQDNVAYGGTIPLKQNEAYEQVHIN